jgi:phytoene desaturase
LKDGSTLSADLFIGNADLPYIYKELLGDPGAKSKFDRMLYTCSTLVFYWGVEKVYPQLALHNVFLGGDYRASFERIFKDHTLPDSPSFYVHAPTRIDPSAAPSGQDTLFLLVPVGHLDEERAQDWEELKRRAREVVFERLSKDLGINDLSDHIKFEVVYSALDWQQRFNLDKGAAFGLSHNFWQVGYLRPQNRHKRYRNLYFVGASTHPGTGLPIVLLSARLTSERIQREIGSLPLGYPSSLSTAVS